MATDFDNALAKVLLSEGGYSNNPKDPGGPTNKGIIQREYDAYRGRNGMPKQSVQYIKDEEVSEIYRKSYWDQCKCDQLPTGVSYVVFDGAVNSGPSQSIKWLQRALSITVDGQIGPATLNAANTYANYDQLVDGICDRRLAFMKALKTWPTFGRGWTNRVADVRRTGKAWANSETVALDHVPIVDGQTAKALVTDGKTVNSKAVGDAGLGGGVIGGVISQSINALTPVTNIPHVSDVLAYLTLASGLLAVAGLIYGTYLRNRKAKLADALDTAPAPGPVA